MTTPLLTPHRLSRLSQISLALIAVGIVLRLCDLTVPDLSTDEAQFALGTSAAQTPLGLLILVMAQKLFSPEIIVVRSVTALFGIMSLPVLYLIAREYKLNQQTALLIAAIAALFPAHILFSRLAYLSVILSCWWLLTLYTFLKATKTKHDRWMIALFLASFAATMTKTQGIVFPLALLIGRIAQTKQYAWKDTIVWTLILSFIPATLYVLTHPGIAATLTLYSGEMYGVSDFLGRITDLITVWWSVLSLFLLAIILCIPAIKTFDWPLTVLLCIGILIGLLLGPGHSYYTVHLVPFALPIGVWLLGVSKRMRLLTLAILTAVTVISFAPTSIATHPWTYHLYKEPAFWNTHATEINELLRGEKNVIVIGNAGHHLRWYLEPKVFVGKHMKEYTTDYLLVLPGAERWESLGEVVWEEGRVRILKRNDA